MIGLGKRHRAGALGCLVLFGLGSPAVSRSGEAIYRDCPECPAMRVVVAGASPTSTAEKLDGDVELAVSVTPITFAEWGMCVEQGSCAGYRPDRRGWPADTPVVNVSYDDAQLYLAWLRSRTGKHYRLVREDEWGFVASGGSDDPYPWGDSLGRGNSNCLDCGSAWDGKRASPVRSFKPNRLGLYDVVGNVAHWTETSAAQARAASGKCGSKADYAAIFGASWAEPSRYLSSTEWACFPKILRDDTIGFRVVSETPKRSRRAP